MLTIEEVLNDVAESEDFSDVHPITVNSRGLGDITPLHFIAMLGDVDAAVLLLDAGAAIDAFDEDGNTALHEAVLLGHGPLVALLVSRGAAVNRPNRAGESPLDLATSNEDDELIRVLRNRV